MRRWFRQLVGDDRLRVDEMAILAILSVLVFLGLSVFAVVVRGQPFDWRAFGEGLGSVIFAACTGMGMKTKLGGQNARNHPG